MVKEMKKWMVKIGDEVWNRKDGSDDIRTLHQISRQ